MKKITEHILVLICLVPLFFINIKTSHDWGDDFAQYIHQSQNILDGKPQHETGYLFNENCYTGPITYPTGFPLLLAPVLHRYGISFYHLNLYMSLFLALCGYAGFLLLRNRLSLFSSLVLTLILVYNPLLLNFKTEVLSDLPFTFFSTCCLLLIESRQTLWKSLLLGVLMGFSVHLRSAGFALLATFALHRFFIQTPIRAFNLKTHTQTLCVLGSAAIAYLVLALIFPGKVNYYITPESGNYWESINDHLSYNLHQLSWIFRNHDAKVYFSIPVVASSCLLVFTLLGLLHTFKDEPKTFLGWYIVVFVFMVVNYRFSHAGLRLLYPLLFPFFSVAVTGLKKSIAVFNVKHAWLTAVGGFLLLFSYHYDIKNMVSGNPFIADGPQQPEAQAVFRFINDNTKPACVIAFDKPRALTLYTKCQSFALSPVADSSAIASDLRRFAANYILLSETQSTENIKAFVSKSGNITKPVYSNRQFTLLEIEQAK